MVLNCYNTIQNFNKKKKFLWKYCSECNWRTTEFCRERLRKHMPNIQISWFFKLSHFIFYFWQKLVSVCYFIGAPNGPIQGYCANATSYGWAFGVFYWYKCNYTGIYTINYLDANDSILGDVVNLYNITNKLEDITNSNCLSINTVDSSAPFIDVAFQPNSFEICIHPRKK